MDPEEIQSSNVEVEGGTNSELLSEPLISDDSEPYRSPSLGGMAGESSGSNSAPTPEERRKRILSAGDARLRRILGRFPVTNEQSVTEIPTPLRDLNMPTSTRKEFNLVESESEAEEIQNGPRPFYKNVAHHVLLYFVCAVFVKISLRQLLSRYEYTENLTYMGAFFLIECLIMLKKLVEATWENGGGDFPVVCNLRCKSWWELFLEFIIYPLLEMSSAFAVYLVSLCLIHQFTEF